MRDVINARPGIQAWWRENSGWFNEEFANYVNQLQQTAKAPTVSGEPTGRRLT
jgi:hypothetical protein